MSHEIESEDRMAYVGAAPWHIGETADRTRELPDDCTRDPLRALEYAGCAYDVRAVPLVAQVSAYVQGASDTTVAHVANVRADSGKVLGVVGPDYEIVQNRAVAEWFRPFCDAGATVETLGTLRNGSRFWCLARLPGSGAQITAATGDVVNAFLLLSHAHDGTMAVRIGRTDVRVVCANTLASAHSSGTSRLVRFKHTRGVAAAMAQAQRIIDRETGEFHATVEQYQYLASRGIVNLDDLKAYVRIVLDVPPEVEEKDISTRTQNQIAEVERLVWHGEGQQAPEVKGTWYAALNGAADYLTHQAGRTEETRMASLWWNDGARALARAKEAALTYAAK